MFHFLIILSYFDTLGQLGAFHGWGVPVGCMLVVCKPDIPRNRKGNYVEIFKKN